MENYATPTRLPYLGLHDGTPCNFANASAEPNFNREGSLHALGRPGRNRVLPVRNGTVAECMSKFQGNLHLDNRHVESAVIAQLFESESV